MPQHRVAGSPDPSFKQPASPAGFSILEDRGGVILAIPCTISPQAPRFIHAAEACDFSAAKASSLAQYCLAWIAIIPAVDQATARRAKQPRLRLSRHRRGLPKSDKRDSDRPQSETHGLIEQQR
jgi:hypothetical protein